MKKLLVPTAFSLLCSISNAIAQNSGVVTESNKVIALKDNQPKKHEFGLMLQSTPHYGQDFEEQGLALQYKYWIKPNVALRAFGGVNPYTQFESAILASGLDSLTMRYNSGQLLMGYGGLGVEVQRHFFKRLYLYASLDVVGGYGKGEYGTYITRVRMDNPPERYISNKSGTTDFERFYLKVVPGIGAKMNFKRISFGVELSGVHLGYQQQRIGASSGTSTTDFNLWAPVTFRTFVSFRF